MHAEQFFLKKDNTDFTYVCMDVALELSRQFVATEGAEVASEWFSFMKQCVANSLPITTPGDDIYQNAVAWAGKEVSKKMAERQLGLEGLTSDQRANTFISIATFVITGAPVTYSMRSSDGGSVVARLLYPSKYAKKYPGSDKYNLPVLSGIVNARISKKMKRSSQLLMVIITKEQAGINIVVNPAHSN